jgi:hypothetical protein
VIASLFLFFSSHAHAQLVPVLWNIATLLTEALMLAAIYLVYASLARRIPDPRLVRRAHLLSTANFIANAGVLLTFGLLNLPLVSHPTALALLFILSSAAILAILPLSLLEIHFLRRFSRAIYTEGTKTVQTQGALLPHTAPNAS